MFDYLDYAVFSLLLSLSAGIGIYYGFVAKKKQDNPSEYLLGGKQMQTIPVSISLIASGVSGFALIGVPAEIYSQGGQYFLITITYLIQALVIWFIFLPVFKELQCSSVYAYLELRFDKSVRKTASLLYAISVILYVPVTIYIPALAFNQTTGINLHYVTPVACLVCMFYTTFGGLRAVVWTDTLQFVSLMGGICLVIYVGLEGTSLGDVFRAAREGGRLELNFDPSPFVRTTFWTMICGAPFSWVASTAINPTMIQRFLSLPSEKKMRDALILFTIGVTVIMTCNCLIGLVIYHQYETCDPLVSGRIEKVDQILPYFIVNVANKVPGLPGLFVAGIFSAALSTMSSCWNSLAGTIYEDLLYVHMPNLSERGASNVMKLIVFLLGVSTIALVFVVERLGSVFSLIISIHGVTYGTLLGIFFFGVACRRGTTKGVISGAIVAFFGLSVISIGSQFTAIDSRTLSLRTDGCEFVSNSTIPPFECLFCSSTEETPTNDEELFDFSIFKISFMYYATIATITVYVIGYLVSVCDSRKNNEPDESLFTPWFRKQRKRRQNNAISGGGGVNVELSPMIS